LNQEPLILVQEKKSMAMRGTALREHILWVAKDVFLEMGFERASMDEIAARAESSKRTLYAHFENKEKLYLAVIELVRGLFLTKLKLPGDYSADPVQALTLFCGRYLEILLYAGSIQMCRVSMAEATRLPEGSAQYFDVIFTAVHERLGAYLKAAFGLSTKAGLEAAQRLLGQILYPRYLRALFGIDDLGKRFDDHALAPDFNLKPIRKSVTELIESLAKH
jgi:AcrR family transcriptional regulator